MSANGSAKHRKEIAMRLLRHGGRTSRALANIIDPIA